MAIDPTAPQGMRYDTTILANQLEEKNEKELAETQKKGRERRGHEDNYQTGVRENLEKAFEVTLGKAREKNDKQLAELKARHEREVTDEVAKGDMEIERIRARYQDQIAQYRENAERLMADDEKKRNDTFATMKRLRQREGA